MKEKLPEPNGIELEVRCNVASEKFYNSNRSLTVDLTRFNNFNCAVRSQAYVMRFFNWLNGEKSKAPLTTNEIDEAFSYILRRVKQIEFSKEIIALKNNSRL